MPFQGISTLQSLSHAPHLKNVGMRGRAYLRELPESASQRTHCRDASTCARFRKRNSRGAQHDKSKMVWSELRHYRVAVILPASQGQRLTNPGPSLAPQFQSQASVPPHVVCSCRFAPNRRRALPGRIRSALEASSSPRKSGSPLINPGLPLAPQFQSPASVPPHARPSVSLRPANLHWYELYTAEWGHGKRRSNRGHTSGHRMTVSS